MDVRVRSWSPAAGPFVGYLITHMESLSLADHLTLREAGRIVYRPTVHYAYRPCPDSLLSLHELLGRGFDPQPRQRILDRDIVQGEDELGVLLAGHPRGPTGTARSCRSRKRVRSYPMPTPRRSRSRPAS